MEQAEAAREVRKGRRLERWALVCIGVAPLVWVPGVVASLEVGPQDNPWQVVVPVYVLFLAPAATAFLLACLARWADRSEGKAAFIASTALLTYSAGWLVQDAGGLATAVVLALAIALWYGLTRKRGASPEAPGPEKPMTPVSVAKPAEPRTPSTATAAFILGVMACLTVIPMGFFFTPPVALPAIIVGAVGLRQAHKRGAPKELAVAGLTYAVCALLAVVGITLTTGWA